MIFSCVCVSMHSLHSHCVCECPSLCAYVCWECPRCEFHPLWNCQRTKCSFEPWGLKGLQISPSIFLLLGGGRLFALRTLTKWPLNHFRVLELGGPSKAFPPTRPTLAQRRLLCFIHTNRRATGKGLSMPNNFAQPTSKGGSKKWSISLVVWESQNSSKQTY